MKGRKEGRVAKKGKGWEAGEGKGGRQEGRQEGRHVCQADTLP